MPLKNTKLCLAYYFNINFINKLNFINFFQTTNYIVDEALNGLAAEHTVESFITNSRKSFEHGSAITRLLIHMTTDYVVRQVFLSLFLYKVNFGQQNPSILKIN